MWLSVCLFMPVCLKLPKFGGSCKIITVLASCVISCLNLTTWCGRRRLTVLRCNHDDDKFELLDVNTYEGKSSPSSEVTETRSNLTEITERSWVILQQIIPLYWVRSSQFNWLVIRKFLMLQRCPLTRYFSLWRSSPSLA